MVSELRVELLGGLRLCRGGEAGEGVTRFRTQKTASLLGYLAYHLDREQPREVLAEQFWPDLDPHAGRNSLNMALTTLRQGVEALGVPAESVLRADRFAVRFDSRAVRTDVREFESALAAAGPEHEGREGLERAVALYRGALLPGLYDDWIPPQQVRLAELHLRALLRLTRLLEASGELDEALRHARAAVAADPLREEAHREVIRLCVAAGEPAAARRDYRELERVLAAEGLRPSPATTAMFALPAPGALAKRDDGNRHEAASPTPTAAPASPGGAVALDCPLYLERGADGEFLAAVRRRESVVLVKGPRQVGKTSLLARGLAVARGAGARVVLTDLQKAAAGELEGPDALFFRIAEGLADQLGLEAVPEAAWNGRRTLGMNLERFLRRTVLPAVEGHLVWAVDGADRLFGTAPGHDLFLLFRAWHNERALDPETPWARLTLAIAYATEPHLVLNDLNCSPFNVGTQLELGDFSAAEVEELALRCAVPLAGTAAGRFWALVGGHPHLARLGLHELARGREMAALEATAAREDGPFAGVLRRALLTLEGDPQLREAAIQALTRGECPNAETFFQLRSAGIVRGDSPREVRMRCGVYERYLRKHLLGEAGAR